MSIRSARNFFREAFGNLLKNGLMSAASIFVVTACLFLFGIFLLVTININFLGEQMENQCQLQVYISREASKGGMIQGISNQLKPLDNVSKVEFLTGEKMFADFKAGLSPDRLASFEGLPADVIPDSFKITLKDITLSSETAKQIEPIAGVIRIENRQDTINIVNTITNAVHHVSIWVVLIFALISVFIISNTIKLALYARRKEINIMKYVGATDSFIRWPFMIEGMLVGLVSAVLSFFITQSVYMALLAAINSTPAISAMIHLKAFGEIWYILLGSYAVLGIAIGAVGSAVSIRKYLKV